MQFERMKAASYDVKTYLHRFGNRAINLLNANALRIF